MPLQHALTVPGPAFVAGLGPWQWNRGFGDHHHGFCDKHQAVASFLVVGHIAWSTIARELVLGPEIKEGAALDVFSHG